MLLRLPYTFTVVGTKKGHRKVEPHVFGSWMDFEIPDITSDDAAVSMRWIETRTNDEAVREVRWFEGANWSAALPRRPGMAAADFLPGDIANMGRLANEAIVGRRVGQPSHLIAYAAATGQEFGNLNRFLTFSRRDPSHVAEFDPAIIRETVSSDRREMEANLVRGAGNLLFVDGSLWLRNKEPCYAVHEHHAGMVTINESSADIPQRWYPASNNFFRADRLDDAMDFAADLSGLAATAPSRIDILIPEAVQYRDEDDALRRSAGHIVEHTFERLRHAPSAIVETWLAVRDSLANGETDFNEVADHLKGMSNFVKNDDDLRRVIERAERRWNLRPLETPGVAP